jgi:peptidyl-prolyl cis-trans isomerase C
VTGAETNPSEKSPAPKEMKPVDASKTAETKKTSPTDIVAKVGTTSINRSELERAKTILMKQNPPQQPLTDEQNNQINDYLIEQLTSAELLYQAGLKIEVKDLEKMVEDKIAQGKARFPSTEEFEKTLKEQNLDEKLLRDYTRKEIIVNNFVEKEIVPKVKLADEDARKFYDENLDKFFRKPDQAKASHILIGVDPQADADTKKKAKDKIDGILKDVKAGKDFAELAKANSTCPSSAQGGDLGMFGKGQMVKPFEDAAFALKPGETSGVVETQFGYHIIKLTEKQEAQTTPFEEVKPKITEYLKGQKVQANVQEYINELKGKIKVEKMLK